MADADAVHEGASASDGRVPDAGRVTDGALSRERGVRAERVRRAGAVNGLSAVHGGEQQQVGLGEDVAVVPYSNLALHTSKYEYNLQSRRGIKKTQH